MDKEEIENRILICEIKERDYCEVGNTKIADRYKNERYKWEKLLDQLNPKMYEELRTYRTGYYSLKQALNKIKQVITECKMLMPHEFDWQEQADNISEIIDKVGGNEE